jgi:transposase
MSAAVPLREDFRAADLRRLARASRDAGQSRRQLALAAIYEGGSRSEAARIGPVSLQTVRDWVMAFNASGPAGLIDRKAPGNAPKLDVAQRQALARVIEVGPDSERHGVVRWGVKDQVVPDNITLMPLPPSAPELNPVENVWQFLRDNWLGDRIFTSYDDIVDHCYDAWNRLNAQPWKIMSLGLRDWAYRL